MSDVSIICQALQERGVERRFIIKLINRQTNAAAALIRRQFGWKLELPEKEREAINKRAAKICGLALAGKKLPEHDEAEILPIATTLGVVALALKPLQDRRQEVEKEMKAMAFRLPAHAWQKGIVGFGELGLAVLISETGDLANYPNFRHVWKRLGLMPFEGSAGSTWRQEKLRSRALGKDEWIQMGYSPHRRAEIHACIADSMAKHQLRAADKSGTEFGEPLGPYGDVYVERRKKTAIDHPDWTKKHAQMDALRIMTKALVSDLWSEWRREHMARLSAIRHIAPAADAPGVFYMRREAYDRFVECMTKPAEPTEAIKIASKSLREWKRKSPSDSGKARSSSDISELQNGS